MSNNRKKTRKSALLLSISLHVLLFLLLIMGTPSKKVGTPGGGSDISAVMVDPGALVEQHRREQAQRATSRQAEIRREKEAAQLAERLQQEQAEQQQRLKQLEKARLDVQQAAKKQAQQQAELQRRAEEAIKQAQQRQQEAEAAAEQARLKAKAEAKALAEAKKKAQEEIAAKQKAAEQARQKAQQAAKQKAAAEAAKKSATSAKTARDVDDLLGGLISGDNAAVAGSNTGAGVDSKAGLSGAEGDAYQAQIRTAIERKLYDAMNYRGRTCTLRINLGADGTLLDVKAVAGDSVLCRAALAAAQQAHFPPPPSQAIWQKYRGALLDFKL